MSAGLVIGLAGVLVGLAGFVFGLIQYIRRPKEIKRDKTVEREVEEELKQEQERQAARSAEERYGQVLRAELGSIGILGSPDIDSLPVGLDDTFVHLRISQTQRSEARFDRQLEAARAEEERYLTPAQVITRAFRHFPLLLIIGDPGSGKTTLLKYYALCCLNRQHRQIGFAGDGEVLPIFLPLRDMLFKGRRPVALPDNLTAWAERHSLTAITARQFDDWLQQRRTLVLLDGLDEIGDLDQRRAVCEWLKDVCAVYARARFVVTSRWTGYRKAQCIELECDHLRADILDFSPEQQREFLHKWFKAALLRELPADDMPGDAWRQQQEEKAADKARTVIDYLERRDNRGLRELAGIPMLLQIMAVIWKEREYLPHSRSALYDASLNYLLDYRDRRRRLDPLLPADRARQVLEPVALWMQEERQTDEAAKADLHRRIQAVLDSMYKPPTAEDFCANLRDRAGLLVDYGEDYYIFRHKTFREFLAARQLARKAAEPGRLDTLAAQLGDDWWEESLRFFMAGLDADLFDRFLTVFFQADISCRLDERQHTLLLKLVEEAPQQKITGLVKHLTDPQLPDQQRRYVMDCLKTTGKEEALHAIRDADKNSWSQANRRYADDIVAGSLKVEEAAAERPLPVDLFKERPPSFRNPFEDNVEYILIPGGKFKYSVTEEMVTVPDIYFCKYPVTNNRYRRFISYLAGEEKEMARVLPLDLFAPKLREFADPIKDFIKESGKQPEEWLKAFRSRADDDRRFNEPDQPVVAVTWYAARAYCFWLSCLEAARQGDFKNFDADAVASIYRLPNEWEWEWAAAGREPDGTLREYPWPKNKGEPTPELANYGENVDATTPVGRYPEGATPEGLMDMAGNVWEWMESLHEKFGAPALRGGSWYAHVGYLCCSARNYVIPDDWNSYVGFRVVRPRS
jgi:formylglycine-generating enzyme required for sulfatase activity